MEIITTHHIINTCKGRNKALDLCFSIDFEPIQIMVSNELAEKLFDNDGYNFRPTKGIKFWQGIIDFCCQELNKEKRDVFAFRKEGLNRQFGEYVLEYVSESDGFHWVYLSKTKTMHFNKFYGVWKSIYGSNKIFSEEGEIPMKYIPYFVNHFESVYKYVKIQGLAVGKSYKEPSHETIDNLIKTITA